MFYKERIQHALNWNSSGLPKNKVFEHGQIFFFQVPNCLRKVQKNIFYVKIVFQVKIYVEVAKVWGKSLGRRFYMKASAAEAEAEG